MAIQTKVLENYHLTLTYPNLPLHEEVRKVSKLGIRVLLHSFNGRMKEDYVSMTSLLSKQRNDPFLKNIISGDKRKKKKCIFWQRSMQKAMDWQGGISTVFLKKVELHWKKVMVCIWWDNHSIINFEYLNYNQTLNTDLCLKQYNVCKKILLDKKKKKKKRPVLIHVFHNARLHSAKIIQE